MPQVRSGKHQFSDALPDAVERLGENKAPDSGTRLKNPMSEFGLADTLSNPCDPVICADLGLASQAPQDQTNQGFSVGTTGININSEAIDNIQNS